VIAVRRETKNRWERRAPLTPSHVRKLVRKGIQVLIQPSPMRSVHMWLYEAAGAIVTEDIASSNTILGVKEVPIHLLEPNKTYVCFSHTIKAQADNMPLLDAILEKNIRLIDYECIVNEEGRRVIGFGRFAGVAGMIDLIRGLGDRMLGLGASNPFLGGGYSDYYHSVAAARTALQLVGHTILVNGTPEAFGPVIFGFTGSGNVTKGALEIFEELPHEYIDVTDLKDVAKSGDRNLVYGVKLEREHLVELTSNPSAPFDKNHYENHPELYNARFHRDYAHYLTALVNCMYWEERFPRLITDEQALDLYRNPENRLLAIADISADPYGSISFTRECTKIDKPFLVHNPETDEQVYSWEADGLLLGSVDNLPAELPMESSQHFGDMLLPFVESLAMSDATKPFEQNTLHPWLERATIASNGRLTPSFEYISDLRREKEQQQAASNPIQVFSPKRVLLLGSGLVAGSFVDHLRGRLDGNLHLSVASADPKCPITDADCHHVDLASSAGTKKVGSLMADSDLVVSLLPATLHANVAKMCIDHQVDMLTTSYVSPEMESLHNQACSAGITILNECGLDPGIDHFLAVDMIDRLEQENLNITRFESWCGGLPAAHCVSQTDPLKYKFSWSPRGVLVAAGNAARYRWDNEVCQVKPGRLFEDVRPLRVGQFELEGVPNRDSLQYESLYGFDPDHIETAIRGTLRFPGFWMAIKSLAQAGLLSVDERAHPKDISEVQGAAAEMLKHLNISSDDFQGPTPLDRLANALWAKNQYQQEDQDMVVLQHIFEARNATQKKRLEAELILLGDKVPQGLSAMARTVGAPAALAAQYLLEKMPEVDTKGVMRPLDVKLARRFLHDLEGMGIRAREYTTVSSL
ncbi:uncharacterized protein MONBRDRAFT_16322, partial [Monosiga brevicollis MX1]